jgi:hypothetical protein
MLFVDSGLGRSNLCESVGGRPITRKVPSHFKGTLLQPYSEGSSASKPGVRSARSGTEAFRNFVVTLSQLRKTARQEATRSTSKGGIRFQPHSTCVGMFVREIRIRYATEVVCGTTQLFFRNFAKYSENWHPSQKLVLVSIR